MQHSFDDFCIEVADGQLGLKRDDGNRVGAGEHKTPIAERGDVGMVGEHLGKAASFQYLEILSGADDFSVGQDVGLVGKYRLSDGQIEGVSWFTDPFLSSLILRCVFTG